MPDLVDDVYPWILAALKRCEHWPHPYCAICGKSYGEHEGNFDAFCDWGFGWAHTACLDEYGDLPWATGKIVRKTPGDT